MMASEMARRATHAVAIAAATSLVLLGAVATVAFADIGGTIFFVSYAGTGAYLVVRRPRNVIGWLLITIGACLGLGTVRVTATPVELASGTLEPLAAATAWANGCGWALVLLGIAALTLVFPSGRMPTGRAAGAAWLVLGGSGAVAIPLVVGPEIIVTPAATGVAIAVPNPLALAPAAGVWAIVPRPEVLFAIAGLPFLAGIVGLVVRYRRSTGLERLQFRWLVAACGAVLVASVAWAIGTQVFELDDRVWNVPVGIAYPTVPIAIAIAVLRYRLYEIDRIISRTIGWAIVTGCLLAAFAGGVVALQALLAGITQGQTLAVAASTLAVFALFQPLRRRVQSAVDRRFDRARYDTQRTADAFAEEIRHDLDLGALRSALLATTHNAVRPRSATLWLRASGERT